MLQIGSYTDRLSIIQKNWNVLGIWWVDDQCVLTSNMRAGRRLAGLRQAFMRSISQRHFAWRWGLKRTKQDIFEAVANDENFDKNKTRVGS